MGTFCQNIMKAFHLALVFFIAFSAVATAERATEVDSYINEWGVSSEAEGRNLDAASAYGYDLADLAAALAALAAALGLGLAIIVVIIIGALCFCCCITILIFYKCCKSSDDDNRGGATQQV